MRKQQGVFKDLTLELKIRLFICLKICIRLSAPAPVSSFCELIFHYKGPVEEERKAGDPAGKLGGRDGCSWKLPASEGGTPPWLQLAEEELKAYCWLISIIHHDIKADLSHIY